MNSLRMILWLLVWAGTAYLAVLLLLFLFQRAMIFHPVAEITQTPAARSLEYEDLSIETEDGLTLHGWFIPADKAAYTVLFFHGNAGNISGRLETVQLLHRLPVNVCIIDYRGYGRSEGKPSEQGTYRDAEAAWRHLTRERSISPDSIIVMGRSLGGAVAAWLASKEHPAGVILESTFTSAGDLAAELYPWAPARMLLRYRYPAEEFTRNIHAPILIAHSEEDQLIPFHHGQQLYEQANTPKTFLNMQGSHGNGFWETGRDYTDALKEFIDSL